MIPHEIMFFFAHAQTVDTRPLFPLPTWPGYEATTFHEFLGLQMHLDVIHASVNSSGVGVKQTSLT